MREEAGAAFGELEMKEYRKLFKLTNELVREVDYAKAWPSKSYEEDFKELLLELSKPIKDK